MATLPDKCVDMILCDLPYGTTACKWDSVIPFEPLWEQYRRLIKPNGAIVLFGSQPFTTVMISSNIDMFKYTWLWDKQRVTGFANAKKQPLRHIEDICVFYKAPPLYNAQGLIYDPKVKRNGKSVGGDTLRGDVALSADKGSLRTEGAEYVQEYTNYPKQTLSFLSDKDKQHPTQKPVALCEYLVKTYTNEGMTVLDNTMGSGTTGVACMNTNRNFIGIERDDKYFAIAQQRIEEAKQAAEALQSS